MSLGSLPGQCPPCRPSLAYTHLSSPLVLNFFSREETGSKGSLTSPLPDGRLAGIARRPVRSTQGTAWRLPAVTQVSVERLKE